MSAFRLTSPGNRSANSLSDALEQTATRAGDIILGKDRAIRLALACLLAKGHLLIEDLPGVGKTTLAHVLARVLGLRFQRIQFTSDLLPADILGVSVFDRRESAFEFQAGPIFSQVILADEINRATPKTQSALLEAMEERQVTQDGQSRPLPTPFFVIATQNPSYTVGTFPLPESQLDRFLMRIELGYPDEHAERILLLGRERRELLEELEPMISVEELLAAQEEVLDVHVSDALVDYVQAVVRYTRNAAEYAIGLSPRAGLAVLRCSQAWAFLSGRRMVLPEDVQAVLPGVVSHRLRPASEIGAALPTAAAEHLIRQVPIP